MISALETLISGEISRLGPGGGTKQAPLLASEEHSLDSS
jgi:hypothetical protein